MVNDLKTSEPELLLPVTQEFLLLRLKLGRTDQAQYVDYSSQVTDITKAKNYHSYPRDRLITEYLNAVDRFQCGLNGLEWVYIKRVDTFERATMDPVKLIEERRRRALDKLDEADIEALEVEKFLIYDKLKNHNVDDEEDDEGLDSDYDDDFIDF